MKLLTPSLKFTCPRDISYVEMYLYGSFTLFTTVLNQKKNIISFFFFYTHTNQVVQKTLPTHLQLTPETGDMEEILVTGTAVGAETMAACQ